MNYMAGTTPKGDSVDEDVDYGSRMLTDDVARSAEVLRLEAELQKLCDVADDADGLRHGVSVIVPSYMGMDRISICLESLMQQDLAPQLFEVILVINGGDDGTFAAVREFKKRYPDHTLRVFAQLRPSAGAARNLGIASAEFSYLTFVDDDDYVGPQFLSALLGAAAPDRVSISPIINVEAGGSEDADNSLNRQILDRAGKDFKLITASSLVGFNACKLFPTVALLPVRYSEDLRSGEDICFMANVVGPGDFNARVSTIDPSGAYFRTIRDDSISRQPLDFDFAVMQRLAVIRELESQRTWEDSARDSLLTTLSNSQANFIKRYLAANTGQRSSIVDAIDNSDVKDFPWSLINDGLAKDLVISYCFAPYSDTSAVVASKAIVEREKVVDVIYNNMSAVRQTDSNLKTIAGRFIDKSIQIEAPASFAGWPQISEFATKGIAVADRHDARIEGGYRTLYSRVLWSGSHFLAALFKLRHPAVRWTAEFSDPLSHDAKGMPRTGDLVRDEMFEVFRRGAAAKGFAEPNTDSLFTWCEFITYVLADEVIFTNSNQLQYMLDNIADKRLRRHLSEKATVRAHPTPPARSYQLVRSEYSLSPHVLNVGYFGAFYENRGLTDVLIALSNSSADVRRQVRLHVFANKHKELAVSVQQLGLRGVVKSQGYRPYLEFLNLASRFDLLLVNDVERTGELPINPFLPSKYSDYLGSGRKVWGLIDEGSPLSEKELDYKSEVGNGVSVLSTLNQIHSDWLANVQDF
jgi:glycosyltransferase involved in cell wall biosynthesis